MVAGQSESTRNRLRLSLSTCKNKQKDKYIRIVHCLIKYLCFSTFLHPDLEFRQMQLELRAHAGLCRALCHKYAPFLCIFPILQSPCGTFSTGQLSYPVFVNCVNFRSSLSRLHSKQLSFVILGILYNLCETANHDGG